MKRRLFKSFLAILAVASMAIGPVRGQNSYNVTFGGFGNDQLNTVYEDQSLPLQLTFDDVDISDQLLGVYEAYVDDGAGAEEIGVTNTNSTVTVTINSAFNGTATIIVDDDGNYEAYLYVTVVSNAPAPTPHTVRMAAGTEDAANWSIASGNASVPGTQVLENVMSGSQVTATYNGTTKKVKSVKAVKYVAPEVITVTWNSTNVFNSNHQFDELSRWNTDPLTYEGITISFSGTGFSTFSPYDHSAEAGRLTCFGEDGDSYTFTAPDGKKFCKIEIIDNVSIAIDEYGDWTEDVVNHKIVWSGTAANTVTLGTVDTYASHLNSIVFKLIDD